MASGREQIVVAAPAAEVWEVVGDFGAVIDYVPGVESLRLEGPDRIVGMGGFEVRERLLSRDDDAMTITYTVLDGPMEHHEATMRVEAVDEGAEVSWSYEVVPDEMATVLGQIYGASLASLKDKLG